MSLRESVELAKDDDNTSFFLSGGVSSGQHHFALTSSREEPSYGPFKSGPLKSN